jgi:hypothetical protein
VRFASGPFGDIYGTHDGHPPAEGRLATAKRDLGGSTLEGFTRNNIRTIARLLGEENSPSIGRLQRRLAFIEAEDA